VGGLSDCLAHIGEILIDHWQPHHNDQGGVHGICVVLQSIANSIVHVDLLVNLWA